MTYRKSWIRGRRCTRHKRVRVKGRGYAMRCVAWGPKRSGGSKRKRRGYRRGHTPFNKGKKCIRLGVNKRGIPTCRSYGGKPKAARQPWHPREVFREMGARQQVRMEGGSSGPGAPWYERMRAGGMM